MTTNLEHHTVSAPRVGKFNVYIQGDLKTRNFIILTVHDLGCNHSMWMTFLRHPSMEGMMKRAAFIHVDVPGQEDDAQDLPPDYTFPSMQSLGEDMVCVLDQLDVTQVICIGEGAGANVAARFAMAHPKRVLGACLIHCTGSTAGFMESAKEKIVNWKLQQIGMNPTAEAYLVLHRFGSSDNIHDFKDRKHSSTSVQDVTLLRAISSMFRNLRKTESLRTTESTDDSFEKAESKDQLNSVIQTFQENLRSKINPRNLKRFVEAFMKRSNLTAELVKLKCPVLMVTGTKASFNHNVHNLYSRMVQKLDKSKCELINIEDIANVLEEKPEKLAECFLYFCQGLGVGGAVPMPRMQRTSSIECGSPVRSRSMSMEEADQPRGIYSTSPTKFGSPPKCEPIPDNCEVPITGSPPKVN